MLWQSSISCDNTAPTNRIQSLVVVVALAKNDPQKKDELNDIIDSALTQDSFQLGDRILHSEWGTMTGLSR